MTGAARPPTTTRRAGPADLRAMAAVQRAAFAEAIAPLLPRVADLRPVEAWEARMAEALETDGVRAALAESPGDGVHGQVVFGRNRDADADADTGEIRSLFVAPGSWRTGAGRALVAAACAGLAELGYTRVSLWSVQANDRANAFYAAQGFRLDGATQTREALGVREIRHVRDARA